MEISCGNSACVLRSAICPVRDRDLARCCPQLKEVGKCVVQGVEKHWEDTTYDAEWKRKGGKSVEKITEMFLQWMPVSAFFGQELSFGRAPAPSRLLHMRDLLPTIEIIIGSYLPQGEYGFTLAFLFIVGAVQLISALLGIYVGS